LQCALLGVTEELHDRRFPFAVLNLDEGETFGAVQLCNFSKLVGLTYCDSGKAFCVDCFHDAAGIERTAKNFETAFTKDLAKIDQLHFEPAIGVIAGGAIERFAISKAAGRDFYVNLARWLEN